MWLIILKVPGKRKHMKTIEHKMVRINPAKSRNASH